MVKKIRTTLRISHAKLDDDIKSNIETALLDMKRLGIETFKRDKEGEIVLKDSQKELKDALVEKAVENVISVFQKEHVKAVSVVFEQHHYIHFKIQRGLNGARYVIEILRFLVYGASVFVLHVYVKRFIEYFEHIASPF